MRKFGWYALALAMLAAPWALAEEDPSDRFEKRLEQVRTTVDRSNEIVQSALESLDWNVWNRAQNDYGMCLTKAVRDIGHACGQYMIATLAAGKGLDRETLEAIDAAATEAGNLTRHHVVVGAYSTLTRRGVRYDKKQDALALMARSGIYGLDAGATGNLDDASPHEIMENPMTGKMPGNPEAADALSRWQQAYMKVNSLAARIKTYENEIEGLPDSSKLKPRMKENLTLTRRQHTQALKDLREWRTKYYEVGGK